MQTDALAASCAFLRARSDKVEPLVDRFWAALVLPDQAVRFEATAKALRVIRQQFGG